MDILAEFITKDGKKIYKGVCNIRSIVIFDDRSDWGATRINEDGSITELPKGKQLEAIRDKIRRNT